MVRLHRNCPFIVCIAADCDFFFFNDTATTEIYTLSLHDALPIYSLSPLRLTDVGWPSTPDGIERAREAQQPLEFQDRKSTRLNSSHLVISYAVFCLKKKNSRKNPKTKSS